MSEIDWFFAVLLLVLGALVVVCAPENAKGYSIAGTIALLIAFVAYPWQKERDRFNELRKEQRADYRGFIGEWASLLAEFDEFGALTENDDPMLATQEFGELLKRANSLASVLALSGSPEVIQKASQLVHALYDTHINYGLQVKKLYEGSENGRVVKTELTQVLRETIGGEKSKHRALLAEMISEMRSQEFGVSGGVEIVPIDNPLKDVVLEKTK